MGIPDSYPLSAPAQSMRTLFQMHILGTRNDRNVFFTNGLLPPRVMDPLCMP